jgi:autotransporter-associated beta strand protein
MDPPLTPVLIITGFLGSGKTNFLNWLLTQPEAGTMAVIVNEFGEIGLDHLLIATPVENIMLIEGGCLCCEVRGDLVQTLGDLWDRRARGEIQGFDQVAIETTGLSNPVPLIQTVLCDESVRDRYTMNKVITLGSDASAASIINGSGANTIVGSIALTTDCIFNIGGTSLTLAGPLTGGLLTKNGTGNLIFSGNPTHAGTVVNAGTATVNGLHNGGITNVALSTIAGTGTNAGFADVSGTLAPGGGGAFGTLTLSGLAFSASRMVRRVGSAITAKMSFMPKG